jgi:hypothetical protein
LATDVNRAAPSGGGERGAHAPPPARVFSVDLTTWIYAEPKRRDALVVGYVRLGRSVALRGSARERGEGCPGGFVPVAPFGFVCLDRTATLDPAHPYAVNMQAAAPTDADLPFAYALSNGTPMYRRLPTEQEWRRAERWLGAPGTHGELSWGNRGHEELAEERAIEVTSDAPPFLLAGAAANGRAPKDAVRRFMPLGSMLAFARAFAHSGRTWLLAADGTVVPADRVRPFRPTAFQGRELGGALELPAAWLRVSAKPKYVREESGEFVPKGTWPVRTLVALDPTEPVSVRGQRYLPTREHDGARRLWLAEADATLVLPAASRPGGAGPEDKWLSVSLSRGTLVAYRGDRAVFTTLISPGAGGIPVPGKDPVKMSTTPLGVYRITFKHLTDTMSPEIGENRSFWIDDVPWAQYFAQPFAIHTAYWHERFGEPMSAGCLNVSPRDGRWLFEFTDPPVPADWNGVGPSRHTGKGTLIVIQR